MIIEELFLFTNRLAEEKKFYAKILGFELVNESASSFTVKAGISRLTFSESDKAHGYHYCFLIPSNQMESAILWLSNRVEILKIEVNRVIQRWEEWNADSIYFLDASGNAVEFIVRHDLKNETLESFDQHSIISVNEIGIPVRDVAGMNTQLENHLGTKAWKGDMVSFGTNGNQNGLFLIPNYLERRTWSPVDLPIEPAPFSAIVSIGDMRYRLEVSEEQIGVEAL